MRVHVYRGAGAIRHVVSSTGELGGAAIIAESGPGAVALELEDLVLDDGDGREPPRAIAAAELLEHLELDGSERARFKTSAPAELRGLRLRARALSEAGDLPAPPPPPDQESL